MAKKEVKVKLERSYNIPIRKKTRETAKHKKTPRAIRVVRQFLQKHMKAEDVKLGPQLNLYMWKHGIKNPPHHVKVHAIKEDDVVKAELEGFEYKEAVKSEKTKEPKTMKEKLEKKLGVKDMPDEEPEKKKEEEKKPEQKEETETKKDSEAAGAETKKEVPKEKTPSAHELAAKKQ